MPKLQVYRGEGFEVRFDPARCAHAGECVRGLPEVFDSKVSPWIRPERASGERIADVVARCPSGALQFVRAAASGGTELAEAVGTVVCSANGPLLLDGPVVVKDASGQVVSTGGKVALCRCGQSSKKPFCDGAHRRVGFTG